MESRYEPKQSEKEIYQIWEKSKFFNPDKLPKRHKKKYVIMIPPPNITGSLHMGHTLDNTIQDIIIRFQRMKGMKTLWLPGTDHAGIATQNVVEKELAKKGLTRHRIGREKFIEYVLQWKEKYGGIILDQLKKLGCSCDWSRTRFTLDKEYIKAVQTAFIHYYKKGYLYRGPRIVNWCPRCQTAISDIEIRYKEEKGKLWYIKYPLKETQINADERARESAFLVVATTRPETMLGDTAVAVNPKDERYKNLIGKTVVLPIMNREIPIIASHFIDLNFGTGVLKVTPAHDPIDAKIGKENKLAVINVIGPDGRMTKETKEYEGLSAHEARKKVINELKKQELLEKEEDYIHQVPLCDRCSTLIEPQISKQWFLKMDELIKPTLKIVEENKIKIIPKRYKKILIKWLENIEDWCISRQLWWGHRLPVWFCQNQTGKFVVSIKQPKRCPFCGECEMKQSEDVLDTWFSSALWPFATLGWPSAIAKIKNKKSKIKNDLEKFYPTNFLTTAQDILYLWVARMIFSSLEFTKKIPFREVYIHPTILNIEGKRMSKSLGTGIDPLKLIEQYGADATRFGIILSTTRDQQATKFDERNVLSARNFVNKLWNIARFIEMKREIKNKKYPPGRRPSGSETKIKNVKSKTLADRWILSRLNSIILSTTSKIENYEFGEAAKELYEFVWHEFADWYLEISKFQIATQKNTLSILNYSLLIILKLLHPFIPFVTEKIWSTQLEDSGRLLIIEPWPKAIKKHINKKLEEKFSQVMKIVIKIRNYRVKNKIEPNLMIKAPFSLKNLNEEEKKIICELGKIIQPL